MIWFVVGFLAGIVFAGCVVTAIGLVHLRGE